MDLAITISLWIVQVIFAALGCWVSLKKFNQEKRKHFVVLFVGLAVVGLGLMAWQAVRAKTNSDDSTRNALGDADHPPSVAEISLPGRTRFLVSNGSNYPAYGIRIRLYDDTDTAKPFVVRNYNYAEMPAHAALMDDEVWTPPDNAGERHFYAEIVTRTGLYREEMILRHDSNDQWARALRVMQGMRKLEDDIDSAWPREADGDIKWDWPRK